MPFEEGKSGNPNGRPKSHKLFKDALTVAIKRTEGDKTMLSEIANALVAKAMLGDVPAIREVADRLDGKSVQAMEHSGPDGGLIEAVTRVELVALSGDGTS